MKIRTTHLATCLTILIAGIINITAQSTNNYLTPASQVKLARLASDVTLAESQFRVDNASELEFKTSSDKNNVVVSIIAPNGQVIDQSNVANFGGEYKAYEIPDDLKSELPVEELSSGFHYNFKFNSQGPGIYTVRYESSQTINDDVVLITKLTSNTSLKVKFFTPNPVVNSEDAVSFAALVFDGSTPVTGATVNVSILLPNGQTVNRTLSDNGQQADSVYGDGIYSGFYFPTMPGNFSALVTVSGVKQSGTAFEFNAGASFKVLSQYSKLTGTFRDYGVDSNNDQLWDKIAVEIDTNTFIAGDYGVFVQLKTNNGKQLIRAARKNLTAGAGNVKVEFEAESIIELNEDGPYQIERIDLIRYNEDDSSIIHTLKNIGLTQSYQITQIQRPSVYFTGNNSVTGIDTNGNGKYESLKISTEIRVKNTGTYYFLGNLVDSNGQIIEQVSSSVAIQSNIKNLDFVFSGTRIVNNGVPGPYYLRSVVVWADFSEDSAREDSLLQTPAYSLDQFDYAIKFTGNNTISTIDTNSNGKFDILRVDSEVTVSSPGYYNYRADLVDSAGRVIDSFERYNRNFYAGNTHINFDFNGMKIRNNGVDGPYEIRNIQFFNSSGELLYIRKLMDTPAYTSDQFDSFAEFTGNNTISVMDNNNNGKYDILRVDAETSVTLPGNYIWQVELIDASDNLIQRRVSSGTFLSDGIHSLRFDFSGLLIGNHGIDGPYKVNVTLYGPNENVFTVNNFIQTDSYSAEDFETGPVLAFLGQSTAVGVDYNANGKFEYLKIESEIFTAFEGGYNISMSLYDSQGTLIETISTYQMLQAGSNNLDVIYFDGTKINNNDVSGSFSVKNVTVEGENQSIAIENFLTTQAFSVDEFESNPADLQFVHQIVTDTGATTNNILEPGENGNISIVLSNTGTGIARSISASLTSLSPGATVISSTVAYENIGSNAEKISLEPFAVAISQNAQMYSTVKFRLSITYNSTETQTFDFAVNIGEQGKLLYVSNRNGNFEIYSMNTDGSAKTNLTNNNADDSEPSWSPQADKIAFTRYIDGNHKIFVMDADGTDQTQVTASGECSHPIWSPDNNRLAILCSASNGNEIYVVNSDGTNLTRITTSSGMTKSQVNWSMNGDKLLYINKSNIVSQLVGSSNDGIYVINLASIMESQIYDDSDAEEVQWSPDNNLICWKVNKGYSYSAERTIYELIIANADGTSQTNLTTQTAVRSFNWSPDSSKIIYIDDPENDYENGVYVVNASGGTAAQIIDQSNLVLSNYIKWSPFDAKLALTGQGRYSTDCHGIFIANSDGSDINCITPASGQYSNPVFKPQDFIKPSSTISHTPEKNSNGWNNSDVTVGIQSLDNQYGSGIKNINYKAEGAQNIAPIVFNGSNVSFNLFREGITTVTYAAKDNTDNLETEKVYTLKIDKTDPISQHAVNINGQQSIFSLTAIDTVSGVSAIVYSIDGGTSQIYNSPISVSNTGGHQIVFYAKDLAGNEEIPHTVYINPAQVSKSVLISEFRTRGYLGADDEFIELYNNSDMPVDIGGWSVNVKQGSASTATTLATINAGVVLPARGHYLLRKGGTSNYSLSTYAEADQTYAGSMADNIGIALISNSSNIIDAVGFSSVTDTNYKEGTALAPSTGISTSGQYSFVRNFSGNGLLIDTNNNRTDFIFVATDAGTYNNLKAVLGSPGPENLSSPVYKSGNVLINQIDDKVTLAESPNRLYDYAATSSSYPVGQLSTRRKLKNNTGNTITALRLRITAITTKNSAVIFPQQALLRLMNSSDITVSSADGQTSIPLKALTIKAVPTTVDGGLNSSFDIDLGQNGLASGQSLNFDLKSGIVTNGQYKLEFRVETLTATP